MMRQSRALPRREKQTREGHRDDDKGLPQHTLQERPQTKRNEMRRTGSFWGVIWQLDDLDDNDWDAMPSRRR